MYGVCISPGVRVRRVRVRVRVRLRARVRVRVRVRDRVRDRVRVRVRFRTGVRLGLRVRVVYGVGISPTHRLHRPKVAAARRSG
jgi:hypothetical protein